MVKVCIFVPCHLRYNAQIDLLYECLSSLVHQTHTASIYISISFGHIAHRVGFHNMICKNPLFKNVHIIYSDTQLYQMEHIHKLTKLYASKYDIILFCDDDDMYEIKRVEEFVDGYLYHMKQTDSNPTHKLKGVVDMHERGSKSIQKGFYEYWCYGLIPNVLIDFFNVFEKYNMLHLLKHKFGDLYLVNYLAFTDVEIGKSQYLYMDTHRILYHYDESNPNSICGSLPGRDAAQKEKDKLYIDTLSGICNKHFKKEIYDVAPLSYKDELKIIYEFCNLLYAT